MSRKHNPWVALVALALLLVTIAAICAGCGAETPQEETPGRFTIESQTSNEVSIRIITDTETGVQYLMVGSGSGYGLTVLEEAEP